MPHQKRVDVAQHRRDFGGGRHFAVAPQLAAAAEIGQFERKYSASRTSPTARATLVRWLLASPAGAVDDLLEDR
ncbi:MAG: hypothetical protein V7603_3343 [Micromonosporaceae bacterium]